uniref:(northern house mosquito) hypothetical protein n=1 Tax=Culex pipiens TaxID=7175 RepID=A0A8D8N912_CULPI
MSELSIKTEPEDDLEQAIPRSVVQTRSAPNLATAVDIVDLTKDEFFCEFHHFLGNVQDLRQRQQKAGAQQRRRFQPGQITDVMALQVAHLQLVSFYQEAYVCSLFGVNFKNVMVYGRVSPGSVRQENNTHIYRLDDGTGTVEVHYPHGLQRDLDNLLTVRCCEDTLQSGGTPLNDDQIPKDPQARADLQLLIDMVKSRCQQRLRYFRLGDHCFAVGRPFQNRTDRVSLYAHSMHADRGPVTELFWKTHLARLYEEKYAKAILG